MLCSLMDIKLDIPYLEEEAVVVVVAATALRAPSSFLQRLQKK
jgi:hypothetical protein